MSKNLAPYQIFFPFGVFSALIAVGVWNVQTLGWFAAPALFVHSRLIAGGFLWSFIVGFLMTAIPRMTGTEPAKRLETLAAMVLMLVLFGSSWLVESQPFYGTVAAINIFLVFYAGQRLLRSVKRVPVFFSHVGLGLVASLLGAFFYFEGDSFKGLHLFHVGSVLLLVLGIGARFYSFLSGLPSDFESAPRWQHNIFHGLGVLTGTFLFLAGSGSHLAYLGLTAVSVIYLVFVWRIQRPANRVSPLRWAVQAVAWMIPLSFALCWLQPSLIVTWLHLIFLGSFAMITFSVSTRVILAHGSYPLEMELSSKVSETDRAVDTSVSTPLKWLVLFLLAALVARVGYGLANGVWRTVFLHLSTACWFLAVGGWMKACFAKIFVSGPLKKPGC